MKFKRSTGISVFSSLLIVWSMYNLMGMSNVENWNFLNQPLSEAAIRINFFISVFFMTLALMSGVGILFLQESFRKIVLAIALYIFYVCLIEGPLLVYRNLPAYIVQQASLVAAEAPDISLAGLRAASWFIIIFGYVLDFGFAVSLIYFFTNPKVKKQFN